MRKAYKVLLNCLNGGQIMLDEIETYKEFIKKHEITEQEWVAIFRRLMA